MDELSPETIDVWHAEYTDSTENPGRLVWFVRQLLPSELKNLVGSIDRPRLLIIFASLRQLQHDAYGQDFESCGVPLWLSEAPYSNSNGFSGCQIGYIDGKPRSQTSWFKFLVRTMEDDSYDWDEMSFVCLWHDIGNMTFFFFDIPIFLKQKFTTDLTTIYGLSLFDEPYSVHMIIVEAAVQQYDHSTQTIRHKLRATEKQLLGGNSRIDQKNDHELQELERAIIFSIENLTVAINTVHDMVTQHAEFLGERISRLSDLAVSNSKDITKSLKFQLQMLENLQTRNKSLAARLRVLQDDQRAEIMSALTRLNRDTLRMNYLSQNMSRGYGSVFFLLLPGIFVSTLLGTDIVQYGTEGTVYSSSAFTVWLAITLPLTLLAVVVGLYLPVAQVMLQEWTTRIHKSTIRRHEPNPITELMEESERSIQV